MEEKNAQNLAMVNDLVAKSEAIRLGGEMQTGVPVDYTTMDGNRYTGNVVFKLSALVKPSFVLYSEMVKSNR